MYKSRSRKTRVSTKNPEKNQRNRSHKATRKQSAAGNNTLKGNQGTPIRNESEPSSTYFLAESSDKDISAQYLRPNIHPIYHQVLESQFPETVEGQPELLAYHYTEAGLIEKAVHYWYHAGQKAIERSAHVEAIAHLRQGLELLETLPEPPQRLQREVDMLIALGASLTATQGQTAPEVQQTYTRAWQLCHHLAAPQQLFPVLRGLWHSTHVRAEYQRAHGLGQQLLTLAQQVQEPGMLLAAHRALGSTLFYLGETAVAHTHYMQGMALYDPQQHRASSFLYGEDAGVLC